MSNSDNDIILTGDLDQGIDLLQEDFMKHVEDTIQESINTKDPSKSIHLCKFLIGAAQLSGLALAKVLYELQRNWWKFDIDEDFTDYIFKEVGKHRHTIERYLKIADMLYNYAPKEVRPVLEKLPIGSLVPIASTVSQGYLLEPEDWQEFAEAENTTDVRRIVREIRTGQGDKSRTSLLSLWMDRNGSIWAFNSTDKKFFVGSLDIKETNEFVVKAVERIVANSGILTQ